jgi:hypothetical protein
MFLKFSLFCNGMFRICKLDGGISSKLFNIPTLIYYKIRLAKLLQCIYGFQFGKPVIIHVYFLVGQLPGCGSTARHASKKVISVYHLLHTRSKLILMDKLVQQCQERCFHQRRYLKMEFYL